MVVLNSKLDLKSNSRIPNLIGLQLILDTLAGEAWFMIIIKSLGSNILLKSIDKVI
jgi:hypothetical protein